MPSPPNLGVAVRESWIVTETAHEQGTLLRLLNGKGDVGRYRLGHCRALNVDAVCQCNLAR